MSLAPTKAQPRPRRKLSEIERRMLALADAMARPGEPLCIQDFGELLGIKAWEASDRIHALRASHPNLWRWKSYPNGARSIRHRAMRNLQRERGRASLETPVLPGRSAPGSLAVLQVVARVRRARALRAAELTEISRADCAFAAEMLECLADGNGRSAAEPTRQARVLRDVAARLRAAAAWNFKTEGAPR